MNNINSILHGNKKNSAMAFSSVIALVLTMNFFQSNELHAAETNSKQRTSYSIEHTEADKTKIDIEAILSQKLQQAPALITKGERTPSTSITSNNVTIGVSNFSNQITSNAVLHSFSIFDARVRLIDDDDFDGYYHHFSVTFDANVSSGSATVYARMYISYEGGPWNHYYTTRTFDITGDSYFDKKTVETIFSTGYFPGDYDILIELFEPSWSVYDSVLSYGPYENNSLVNVPLEDEGYDFYDSYYDNHVVAGCSLSLNSEFDPVFPVMLLLSLIYVVRRHYIKYF